MFNGDYILDNKENILKKYNLNNNCLYEVKFKNEILTECFNFKTFFSKYRKIKRLEKITIFNNNFDINNSFLFNSLFNNNIFDNKNKLLNNKYKKEIIKKLKNNNKIYLNLVLKNNLNENIKFILFKSKCHKNKCKYEIIFSNNEIYLNLANEFYKKLRKK